MRRIIALALAGVCAGLVPAAARAEAFPPHWVAGDLHVHTIYSHDSYGGPLDDNTGPEDFYTLGWTVTEQAAIAKSRGLDYLAITDHNDTRSQADIGWGVGQTLGLTMIPAYENSLAGHAQMLGATACYAPEGRLGTSVDCNSFPEKTSTRIQQLANALRADGGAFQINHPASEMVDPDAWDWGYGYDVVPDSVEVWNIGPWVFQPPAPASNSNDDSLRYWEGWLNRGYHVAATGGSDNHWRSTTAVQGVGQPTTWVYVTQQGAAGVIDGIRAARTTVSHQPPAYGGARIFLEADADGNGTFEAMIGDTVPPGSAMRVRAENVVPGGILRIVTNLGSEEHLALPETRFTPTPNAKWVRAEIRVPDAQDQRRASCDPAVGSQTTVCRNRLVVEALTSAMYIV